MKQIYDFLGYRLYAKPDPKIASILKSNKNRIGKNILDLCCGSGRYAFYLNMLGASVLGVDINDKAIKIALKKKGKKKEIEFICNDVMRFNTNEKFSAILLLGNSLAHFSKSEMSFLVSKYKKNLVKRGLIIVELSLPNYILAKKEFKWKGFHEKVVDISFKSGLIKRKFIKRGKSITIDSYIWSKKMLDRIFKKNKMKFLKQYILNNCLLLFYENG